jgi:cytosine/adenosine deaminase-related metal-dependent hydrolase
MTTFRANNANPILIENVRVLALEGDVDRPPEKDVLVADSRIKAITEPGTAAQGLANPEETMVVDGTGKLLIPGLINAHYHSADTLAKGRFDNLSFDLWMLHANPFALGNRSRAEIRVRTLLGALENIRSGVTTIQDMNNLVPQDEETLDCVLDAYRESGIRTVFSISVRDLPALDIEPFIPRPLPEEIERAVKGTPGDPALELSFVEAQLRRLGNTFSRLHWALSPSGPQRCSSRLLEGIAELSQRFELPVLTHLYETRAQLAKAQTFWNDHGGSLVRYMDEIGILTNRTTIAHGVYLAEPEIAIMAGRGAGIVHNPVSNLKLKNGVAPLHALASAGINIALGCDNNSCSDCQNLFQVMKFFLLLAQSMDGAGPEFEARRALDAATLGGAKALGLEQQIGAIKPGLKADLVLLDLNDYAYQPLNSAARQLVFSETGRGVHTVIIDGQIVLREGRHTLIDEAALREELKEVVIKWERDYLAHAEMQRKVIPYISGADEIVRDMPLGLNRLIGARGLR